MNTAAERLKWARRHAGFETAAEVADRTGIPYGTYVGHENGSRGITTRAAERYAQLFRVSVSWILFGIATDAVKAPPPAPFMPGFHEQPPASKNDISVSVQNGTAFVKARITRKNYDEFLDQVTSLKPLLT